MMNGRDDLQKQRTSGVQFKKALRLVDMTLFNVSAIHVLDTLAPSAAVGPSTVSWWLITLVLFFIPYGLMVAELGTTYPSQGGLYDWIKRAYGPRWAARATWLYWINVALWMPSVYILFAGMFAQLFFPNMSLWVQITVGIGMTWLTVVIGVITLRIGKWVPNLGAVLKGVITIVLGVGAFLYAARHGVANDLSLPNLLPSWDAGLSFLPVIVFNFMGFELISGAGDEMDNPGRDIPRAIMLAGFATAFFYLLGTVGMLVALPLDDLGLITGIVDTFRVFFGKQGFGGILSTLMGVFVLYTLLATMVTWTMGANRSTAHASAEGELPHVFGILHSVNKSPLGAFLITGLVSSAVLLLYGLTASSAEGLFWSLFAFSSMVFLLPYLAIFPAFLRLRRIDADRPRRYRMPGGSVTAWLSAAICELFILQALVLFVWVPGQPMNWAFSGPVLAGVVIVLLVGEVSMAHRRGLENKKIVVIEDIPIDTAG